jgi:hypothetical protein
MAYTVTSDSPGLAIGSEVAFENGMRDISNEQRLPKLNHCRTICLGVIW